MIWLPATLHTIGAFLGQREYDANGKLIYYENSNGEIINNRPKKSCNGKVVEIDGKKYKLKEL